MVLSYRWNYSIAHHCVDAPRRELPSEPLRLDQEDAGTTAEGAAAAAAPAGGEPAVAAPAPSPANKGAGQSSKKCRA